ncbi:acyl-CoA thioesterase [Anoxybacillus sp. LAT_35]|uniref:acyl-CoA thioesterase n=1 Tax=Anoxybacillus TaxID=150247 RepID=UPI001EDC781E|nr:MULTISPECIES: thioesterase family protein [Anoxybacillus]MCG5025906.1 acyl-CoA thioesterase [Anoxybacillus flavithermus]MCG6198180.1 acyl-CoA thioesterase [Anoxybacillus sp. LAT_38]MCG3086042.1 acyl-CoA thioesterase [Anoxybacillus sp. LAT27]MCG6172838.1 acyl-CoA thioesterase [Anoxybacillus sp. LAT_11]MCG6173474.1 acyl-CoA thioesterase [Anoxybacillus sp. LAT_11]
MKVSYIDDIKEWEQRFSFFHRVRVRFSETDMFGHLNNTVPFVYFEEARIAFFEHLGFMNDWLGREHDAIPVVANLQCDFLQQVYFGEQLQIGVKVAHIGNSSVDLHYVGKKQNGAIAFTGRGTMVQMSKTTGKGVAWDENARARLIENM